MLLRNYKFRIYPTKSQRTTLEDTLELNRQLYNTALEQRISAWRRRKKSLSGFTQSKELPLLKQSFPEYREIYAQVLQSTLGRLQKAYQNFFRRVKTSTDKPGFPRFKSKDRYHSFTYPQKGFSVNEETKRIKLSKIGTIKIKQWRPIPGKLKQVTVKQEGSAWYTVLCCEFKEPEPLPKTGKSLGLDVGLKSFVMDSNRRSLGNLNEAKAEEKRLRKIQSRLFKNKKRGSGRRKKTRALFGKKCAKLARKRTYRLHCISKKLIAENDLLAIEGLKITQMASKKRKVEGLTKAQARGMRRNIHLASWGQLREQLIYKAEEAGRQVVLVNPRGTTQLCSCCGTRVPKTLRDRLHDCPECGLVLDRDHNAAINILQRALQAPRGGPAKLAGPVKRKDYLRPQICSGIS